MATSWTKLADLTTDLYKKTLTVRPLHRPYLSQQDCLYDYTVGHDFLVIDQSSPLNDCLVTVCDRHTLKSTYGVSHLHIRFNPGMAPIEVAL